MATRTDIDKLPQAELRQRGLQALERELGIAGMEQFLRLLEIGRGDYIRDRVQWLGTDDLDTLATKVQVFQQEQLSGKLT